MVTFVASLLAYGIELGVAIAFIANPHNTELIDYLAFVLIDCFAVALNRAWQLLQSTAVGADVTVQTPPTP
jgi:hypothetical protein